MRVVRPLAIFLGIVTSAGCKTTRPEAQLKHNLGEVSWSEGRWTYLNLDRPTFIKMNNSNYLPEDHKLSVKAKEWVARIHNAVVRKFPEKMQDIPTPQIIVMRKSSPDAFAARRRNVSYNLKTGLFLTGAETAEPPSETRPLYFAQPNVLSHNIFPVELAIEVDEPQSFRQWFSKRFAPCSMEPANRQGIQWSFGSSCKKEDYLKTNHWTPAFVTQAAPNWVIVTAGLFAALPNEESFAAVIAHELAHYYRAHVVNDSKDLYSYCYMLDDPQHKPVERDELKTLCKDLKAGRSRAGMSPQDAAARIGLGVYTYEQEADELALEFLTLLGIEPLRATDAWFALFEQGVGDQNGKSIPLEKCRELFASRWQDAEGSPVQIPIGDYSDPHHSWCYRIFNTTQEIANHAYKVSEPAKFDPASWQEFRLSGSSP